jgi:hypothetical protein
LDLYQFIVKQISDVKSIFYIGIPVPAMGAANDSVIILFRDIGQIGYKWLPCVGHVLSLLFFDI